MGEFGARSCAVGFVSEGSLTGHGRRKTAFPLSTRKSHNLEICYVAGGSAGFPMNL